MSGSIRIQLEKEFDGFCKFTFDIHLPHTTVKNIDTKSAA
jgi:hypothetical protein